MWGVDSLRSKVICFSSKGANWGHLGGSAVEHLPLAQSVILEFRDRVPHRAPCRNPDVGLDPGTPGSGLEPKADAQSLSHPGSPRS